MHENSHFLSYRKRCHDAENHAHYVTLGSRCKMASSHRVTDLEKIPVKSPSMKLRRYCQQLGLCLFPPCYLIFLETFQVRGVSVFFVLFTLAFTTGQTSSGSLPFIGCFILFSQCILVCFIICKNNKFCSFQFNRLAISWPPWLRVWGWASDRFLPLTVFSLCLPFCFSSYIIHLRCTSEGGSLEV